MPIVWRDQISVGNDLIDQDHRYLICLVNSIDLALRHEDDSESLLVFVQQLIAYTAFHFQREERIQKLAHYPQYEAHCRVHKEILGHLAQVERDVRDYHAHVQDGSLVPGERDMVAGEVMQLLRDWVLDHVLKDDKRMEPYLRKLPANFG